MMRAMVRLLAACATGLALAASAACGGDEGGAPNRIAAPGETQRGAATAPSRQTADPVASLTTAQLAGQRLVASMRGTATPPAALRRRIARGELAGVILFAENGDTVAAARRLADRLQAIRRPPGLRDPLLIMIDQEGGAVRRLRDAPPAQSAARMAAAGRGATRAAGAATGRALRRAGVNVDLAPVADVAGRGSALAREGRTFGRTPARAGALASAFVRGLRAGGVASAVKHFPGMGAARANTDDAVVRIGASAARLRARDEPPFRAAIAAGAELVMLANAIYPALDRDRPASLSRAIAVGELRDRLGFDGVTITDDLEANALKPFGDPGPLAELGAAAGVDLLLFARSYQATERAAAGLERAVAAGRLSRAQLEAGARRVLALRAALARRETVALEPVADAAPADPPFTFAARRLTAAQRRAMTGVSWRPGCPVGLGDLRRLRIAHWDFRGRRRIGRLIVHRDAVAAMRTAFARLYEARFPIRRMRPVDAYGGDDFASIEADNTSAFNCRPATGSTRWSQHAYGRAIDVNPIENPYVGADGTTAHRRSIPYLDRSDVRPGMAVPRGPLVRAFAAAGWGWGGRWRSPRDHQHFSAAGT